MNRAPKRRDRPAERGPDDRARVARRVASAWAAFFVLLAAFWVGLPALVPLYLALGAIAILEYAAMMRLRGVRVHRTALLIALFLHAPTALPASHPWSISPLLAVDPREALALGFLLVILAVSVGRPHRYALETVGYTLLGYLWIPAFFSYLLTLRVSPDAAIGLGTVVVAGVAAIAADVGGWWIGRSLGRRPLSPVLSPDKTIEGAIGGLALAAAATPAFAWALQAWGPGSPVGPLWALPFGLLVATAAQVGDLFESLVKRWAGVKDTGLFLPGQGGVLDRIDSHLFALPVAYLTLTLADRL